MKTALALILLCSGCAPNPDTQLTVITGDRIKVTRIGVIQDELAYNNRRGIYIITDTKTGKEYVGVSGIGISELGTTGGKHPTQIEQ